MAIRRLSGPRRRAEYALQLGASQPTVREPYPNPSATQHDGRDECRISARVTEITKEIVVQLNSNGIAAVRWVEMRDRRACIGRTAP
jgi:hypothetical protein